jgi:ATP-dependent Clp protease ATP-binding subunit ClpC
MFDKYTESARRSVFFAHEEACNFGNKYIETYHLLIGILRQDESLRTRLVGKVTLDELRAEFAHLAGSSKLPTSVDLPLSHACKRAMAFAAEESQRAKSRVIDPEHLLAGILRECTPASDELQKRGVTLQMVRESFGASPVEAEMRVQALLDKIERNRLPAATRILEALASPDVTISVTTPTDQFTISFPPVTTV